MELLLCEVGVVVIETDVWLTEEGNCICVSDVIGVCISCMEFDFIVGIEDFAVRKLALAISNTELFLRNIVEVLSNVALKYLLEEARINCSCDEDLLKMLDVFV